MKITKQMGIIPDNTTITTGDPVFLSATNAPFCLYGLCEPFRRVPKDVAKATSESVKNLAEVPSGARIRFRTDSDYIVMRGEVTDRIDMFGTMTSVATDGFDVFEMENGEYRFRGIMSPSQRDGKKYVESRIRLAAGMKDIMIHLPLFTALSDVYVALREGSELEAGSGYKYKTPVVFYGSSIVNGVGVSRPSSAYPAIISRKLDCDFINLGFSGAAKAEPAIIDYIKTLDMSVFVYDYDHNAPDADFLKSTHYAGYKRFRDACPDVPVIMASKPDYHFINVAENEKRRKIIEEDYLRALSEGDKNICFVDGSKMYDPRFGDEATSDGCHPNDLGAMYMATAIGEAVKKYLK